MTFVDTEGVPRYVQAIRYWWSARLFVVNLFDGREVYLDRDEWFRQPRTPTGEDLEDVAMDIERHANRWGKDY